MKVTAIEGGALNRVFEFEVGTESVALTAEKSSAPVGGFSSPGGPLMVLDFPASVKGGFFRPAVDSALSWSADQAADVQPIDGFFVVPKNGGGQFCGYGVGCLEKLGRMALGAGEVGLGGLTWAT